MNARPTKATYHSLIVSIFYVAVTADCFLQLYKLGEYRSITRPIIVPLLYLLIAVEATNTTHPKSRFFISMGLLFSFLSDIMLFYNVDDLPFLLGIICYCISRIWYMIFFLHLKSFSSRNIVQLILGGILISGFFTWVISYVWEGLLEESFTAWAIVYAVILLFMVLAAVNTVRGKRIGKLAKRNFIPGAILLMLGDAAWIVHKNFTFPFGTDKTLIADFYRASSSVNIVMVSIAQLIIVNGALKIIKK